MCAVFFENRDSVCSTQKRRHVSTHDYIKDTIERGWCKLFIGVFGGKLLKDFQQDINYNG